MKKLASLAAIASLASVGLLAPASIATADDAVNLAAATSTANETLQQRVERLLAGANVSADVAAKIRAAAASLPADLWNRVHALNAKLGIDSELSDALESAINPSDYVCEDAPLTTWLRGSLAELGATGVLILLSFPILDYVTYDAILNGVESKDSSFGYDGSYTQLLRSQMKDLKKFWDFDGSDIKLFPIHGEDAFSDNERLAETIQVVTGVNDEDALVQAEVTSFLLDLVPTFERGAHPIFTFNAFAYDPVDEPELVGRGLTKGIAVGDGILHAYEAIGFDKKVAPRAILAHEYGHQVQFAESLLASSTLTGPEATRRYELMADAFGTYYMVHSKGEALNAKRTLADQQTFFNVGDCGYADPGHHGTPNQRFNAAAWAAGIVNSAPNQGHKLGGAALAALFEAKLPELVAPDAH